jgi:hypothetical protein
MPPLRKTKKRVVAAPLMSAALSDCQGRPEWTIPPRHPSCMQLVRDVIKDSERNATENPRNWRIVSINSVTFATSVSDYECRGMAKLNNGKAVPLGFGVTDNHGNQAPLYSFDTE